MEQEKLIEAYEAKRYRRAWAVGLALGGMFLGFPLTVGYLGQTYAAGLGILILIGFALYTWLDWRCPSCEKPLGPEWSHPFCRNCGTRLTL